MVVYNFHKYSIIILQLVRYTLSVNSFKLVFSNLSIEKNSEIEKCWLFKKVFYSTFIIPPLFFVYKDDVFYSYKHYSDCVLQNGTLDKFVVKTHRTNNF